MLRESGLNCMFWGFRQPLNLTMTVSLQHRGFSKLRWSHSAYVHIGTYTCIYIYICTYMFVCMCMCMHKLIKVETVLCYFTGHV